MTVKRTAAALLAVVLLGAACGGDEPEPEPTPGEEAASPATSPSPGTAEELVLTCTDEGQTLSADRVEAQPDGIRVVVDNRRDHDPGMAYGFQDGSGGGASAPVGRSDMVFPAAPGPFELGCNPVDPGAEFAPFTVEVVDPRGHYSDDQLACQLVVTMEGDFEEEPEGHGSSPRAARERLEGEIDEGDEIHPAGYPQAEVRIFVVVRDGEVLGRVRVVEGERGWYAAGYDACEELRS